MRAVAKSWLVRVAYCMAIAWMVYNPWLSLVTHVGPYLLDVDALARSWPVLALGSVLLLGMGYGCWRVISSNLGPVWTLFLLAVLGLLAYLPFFGGLVAPTLPHALYAAWLFVVPVLVACAMSSGPFLRAINGVLPVQSMGAHPDLAHARLDDPPSHHHG